jgi:hypothetical protein
MDESELEQRLDAVLARLDKVESQLDAKWLQRFADDARNENVELEDEMLGVMGRALTCIGTFLIDIAEDEMPLNWLLEYRGKRDTND